MSFATNPSNARRLTHADELPPLVSDHQLLGRIGAGSYGEVWLARSVTGAHRAVKIVRRNRFEDARPYEREYAGIQHFEPVSRSHAGLIHLLHVGRDDIAGLFFCVMELGDNETPGQAIEPGRYSPRTLQTELSHLGSLPAAECIRIALALSSALEHLHEHGLIHRDVKPANVIFVNEVPKLADIGLVSTVQQEGTRVGTSGFMPPEGAGSPSSDLYSLGKTLYEMALGKDRQAFPQLPGDLRRRPDKEALLGLNEIILKACATDVHQRYFSASQMRLDLERLQEGQSLADLRLRCQRARLFAVATAIAILITAGSFVSPNRPQLGPNFPEDWKSAPATSTAQYPVDLSRFYNARLVDPVLEHSGNRNTLASLPEGVQKLTGITFSIGGVVYLNSPYARQQGFTFPTCVVDIPVQRQCRYLYFLHANSRSASEGETVAHFVVNYVDRQHVEVPLVFGQDLLDWWMHRGEMQRTQRALVAWMGTNPEAGNAGARIQLFRSLWKNPRPNIPVTTVEYVSDVVAGDASPFLVAVTADGWRGPHELQSHDSFASLKGTRGPGRDGQHPVDLAAFYNASLLEGWQTREWSDNDLADLPTGRQKFDGVEFEIGGVVQTTGKKLEGAVRRFPQAVKGMPVQQTCHFLHLLHASGGDAADGTLIARVILHYADGSTTDMPVIYGEDVRNWWHNPGREEPTSRAKVAWTGFNQRTQRSGLGVRLYKSTWANPKPLMRITSLDYVSALENPTPFLLAITTE